MQNFFSRSLINEKMMEDGGAQIFPAGCGGFIVALQDEGTVLYYFSVNKDWTTSLTVSTDFGNEDRVILGTFNLDYDEVAVNLCNEQESMPVAEIKDFIDHLRGLYERTESCKREWAHSVADDYLSRLDTVSVETVAETVASA